MIFNDLMQIYAPWSQPQQDGSYSEMAMRLYHEDMAVGSSAIGILQQPAGAAFYFEKYLSERRQPYSEGDDIGSMAHKMVLEPDRFFESYSVCQDIGVNKITKSWREFKESCAVDGLVPITKEDFERVESMRDAVLAHPIAKSMLESGFTEHSYFSTCPDTGVREKARPDHVSPHPMRRGKFVGIDYKTTGLKNLGIKKWSNQEAGLGRHIQAAHHKAVFNASSGMEMVDFYHIVQMQDPPYLVRTFRIPERWFEEGEIARQIAKTTLVEALETGDFKGYPLEVEDLLDPWSFNSEEM